MSSRKSHALGPDFWARFATEHWEKAPGVFPGVFAGPILSPDEVLRGLKVAFGRLQAGDPGARPRCYLEGAEVSNGADYARLMPTAADTTLQGYADRLSKDLGKGFGIVVNAFHVHHPALWHRLRAFFRGLYAVTGLPAQKTDPVLFFGNYPVTPFGVHTDEASVFTFNLAREKRMLAWPRDHFSSRGVPAMATHLLAPHAPHAKDAVELRMGPADLMYWPSSHWHVGVSGGELLATLGVGVYFAAATTALVEPALRLAMRGAPALTSLATNDGALGPELERALADVAAAVESGALRRELHAEWLRRLTADGCLPAPPLVPVALAPKDRVQLGEGERLLHAVLPGGLLLAAGGQSWFLAPAPGAAFDAAHAAPLLEALAELGAGEPVRVGQLAKRSAGLGAQTHAVLEALAAAGAIEKLR
jgi:50S ribosomal protein L16 3-hydroxylase